MRKAGSIVFLIVYLFALNSWSANVHYCGNDIMSVAVFDKSAHDCCCKNTGCKGCEDKVLTVESHDEHETAWGIIKSADMSVALAVLYPCRYFSDRVYPFFKPVMHIPPLKYDGDIYLLHRSFLI